MLGSERVRAVLVGAEPDRTPVQYHFLGGAHSVLARVGTSMAVAYSSPTSIANTQIAAAEMFGHDTAMAPWGCLTVEAQAFGCELNYHDMWYPQVRSRPLTDTTDLSRLNSIGPDLAGRMPLMIDALAELRRRSDGELFVIAMVVSPFLVACELRDMSQLMLDIGLEPTFVAELLETVADGLGTYVDAIAASGAVDAIMFENAGMGAELLGPHHVETFVRPNHRRLVAKARAAAPDVFLIEHNCASSPYFTEIHQTDVDAISFAVDDLELAAGTAELGRHQTLIGSVDHAGLMLNGSPDQVRGAALRCIERAGERPFILSTGCEVPFKAPAENIAALADAAREASTNQPTRPLPR